MTFERNHERKLRELLENKVLAHNLFWGKYGYLIGYYGGAEEIVEESSSFTGRRSSIEYRFLLSFCGRGGGAGCGAGSVRGKQKGKGIGGARPALTFSVAHSHPIPLDEGVSEGVDQPSHRIIGQVCELCSGARV